MAITLYGIAPSPPCRGVQLVCKALGIEYEWKNVDLMTKEHLKPEFLKINPHHVLPTIVDGDYVLWESHAIVTYLGDKAGNDSWYPKDIKKRATIQQRLHFDNFSLFGGWRLLVEPVFFGKSRELAPEGIQRLQDAISAMECLIQEGGWLVAGDHPTIADCSCAPNVATITGVLKEITMPPKVAAWLQRCREELPGFDEYNTPFPKMIATMLTTMQGKKE